MNSTVKEQPTLIYQTKIKSRSESLKSLNCTELIVHNKDQNEKFLPFAGKQPELKDISSIAMTSSCS